MAQMFDALLRLLKQFVRLENQLVAGRKFVRQLLAFQHQYRDAAQRPSIIGLA
jgi:hypothetical protein